MSTRQTQTRRSKKSPTPVALPEPQTLPTPAPIIATQTGPVENGLRLATFSRGMSEEMRVNWASYNGHPFLALRVWYCGMDGVWRPDKMRGCTIKLRELSEFAHAVHAAAELATADG